MEQSKYPIYRTGIGQDSHRFCSSESSKVCIIGGVVFEGEDGLASDSDGDVILHAICNAITSLTGVPILGQVATELCKNNGITDSEVYLEKAMQTLGDQMVVHVALSVEGKRPCMQKKIDQIRENIARCMQIDISQVGLTVTSGDGLTDFGCGDGLQCLCTITSRQ